MIKKKIVIALSAVAFLMVAFITTVIILIFSFMKSQRTMDYYQLGEDSVATMKLVVGERKISGVSTSINNGITTKTYNYQSATPSEDIQQYITYLGEIEGYNILELTGENDEIIYGKQSVESGKVILIHLDVTAFGYTIMLQKGEGEITLY